MGLDMPKRVSEDFVVGQTVVCRDPEGFRADVKARLLGRKGVVEAINPSKRPDEYYCQRLNVVYVRWLKRNGRGKEFCMFMRPEDIDIVEA